MVFLAFAVLCVCAERGQSVCVPFCDGGGKGSFWIKRSQMTATLKGKESSLIFGFATLFRLFLLDFYHS